MEIICKNCGAKLSSDFRYCPECNTPTNFVEVDIDSSDNIIQDTNIDIRLDDDSLDNNIIQDSDIISQSDEASIEDNIIQGSNLNLKSAENTSQDKSRSKNTISDNILQDSTLNIDQSTNITNVTNISNIDLKQEKRERFKKIAYEILEKIGRENWLRESGIELTRLAHDLGIDAYERNILEDEVLDSYNKLLERDRARAKYRYTFDKKRFSENLTASDIAQFISEQGPLEKAIYIDVDNDENCVPFWSIGNILDEESLKLFCSVTEQEIPKDEASFCSNCHHVVSENYFNTDLGICHKCEEKVQEHDRVISFGKTLNIASNILDSLNTEEWIKIKLSRFLMGSPKNEEFRNENEKQHYVNLDNEILVFRTPITVGFYSQITDQMMADDPTLPVSGINWLEAIQFCNRLSKFLGFRETCYQISNDSNLPRVCWNKKIPSVRLLTETEWEYVCRAGTSSSTFVPEDEELYEYAWYDEDYLSPVRSFKPNPFGLYDMLGNVWEWVWDDKYDYPEENIEPYKNNSQDLMKVVRGCSIAETEEECRSAYRNFYMWNYKSSMIGIRVAIDIVK